MSHFDKHHLNASSALSCQESYSNTQLTPSQSAELENIRGNVGIEDFDKSEVHIDSL